MLIASLHASAATPPTLSIEGFSIKAGETKELLVDLNNPDDQIANVQFLLNLPTGLTVAQKDGKSLITLTNRASGGHQVMDNPSSGMVMVYSMPVAAFSGTSGAILSISLTAGTGFAGGNVALRSIVLATEQGGQYKPDDVVYTIENKVPVTGITLNATSQELNAGQTFQLSATVAPSNATNKSVKWSSSKSSVATVSSTGLVTAVAAGSATITCEAQDGSGVKATCNITVKAATVAVTGITLNATSKELTTGQTFQLSATVAPSNATNKNVTWNSNKTSVATVSSNGLVTAVAAGSATITCEAQDGSGVKATCSIIVKAQPIGNNIQFADAEVKRICVENWDTNGDGELSKEEAAAVKSIGTVFKDNNKITSFDELQYFTNLKEIGEKEFSYCSNLQSIILPNSVETIGRYAFQGCALPDITIPASVISIDKTGLNFCFKNIFVDPLSNSFSSFDGVLFSKDATLLHTYPQDRDETSYVIPNTVTTIGSCAFYSCVLTSVTIPYGVVTIGNSAFRYCRQLESINIPASVTTLESNCFEYCDKITTFTIPSSVTSIENAAMGGCKSLMAINVDAANENYSSSEGVLYDKELTRLLIYPASKADEDFSIPNSIIQIDAYSFIACDKLKAVTIPQNVKYIYQNAFNNCANIASVTAKRAEPIAITYQIFDSKIKENATLYVPNGSKNAYKQIEAWNFKHIVEMEAPDITIALDDESKISSYWYAISSGQAGVNKDEIHVNPAVYGQAGANIYNWTYDVFSTFMSGRPKLTVTGADANSVTPLLAFRSVGSLQASSNGDALLCNADTIAKVNGETGVVTMVMSNSTMSLLNRAASNDYVNALTLPLCVKARYNGTVYDVDDGNFAAKVLRPVNAVDKELANQDITSGAATLNLGELVNLTDWRNYSINTRGLFDFYDIESITVMGATNSSNVGSAIMASVNGSWGSVSGATDKLTFAYQPKSLSANAAGTMPDYGTLTIANNGFSGDMQLSIPVTVSYAWGEVQTTAYVTVTAEAEEPDLKVEEFYVEGDGIVGTLHSICCKVKNYGATYTGRVYLHSKLLRATVPASVEIWNSEIPKGFLFTSNRGVYFVEEGTFRIWLSTDEEGNDVIGEIPWSVTPAATLTARNYTREYGEENPDFGFTADKGGFSGTPKITCTADRYSDVGTYDIVIEQGSVDNNYVTLVPGTLTITKAPLTVSAGSWLNREGWEPAGITPKYENFKNGEDKSVLTKEPQFTTTATAESPMGSVHQLTFSGAEAKNYAFNYIPGTITIIGRPGDVNRDSYINTTDAVDVIQYILGYNSLQDIFDGDLYRDDQITISDVASVIDYIMANGRAATRRTAPLTATTSSMLGLTLDEQGRLAVTLRNDMPFIGFQFDVTLPGGAELSQVLLSELRRNGHSVAMRHMDDGSYRVLVYSMQNNTLHGSDGTLATLLTSAVDGDMTLSNIHFADADCVDHQLPDVSLTMLTGISTLTEGAGTFDIYDLNGRLVRRNATSTKGLHRGIYMINNQKVIIK